MSRPHLLLLHGALGAASQFAPLLPRLADHYTLHALDFEGHGAQQGTGQPLSMQRFAANVLAYLDAHAIDQAHCFGYSMGGYVALLVARQAPQRLDRIATLGTKWLWDSSVPQREAARLDPAVIEAKVPAFAQALAERHTAVDWRTVVRQTAALLIGLGETPALTARDWPHISHAVRVMAGDRDTNVGVEESAEVARELPRGELAVLPRVQHPLERVPLALLSALLIDHFSVSG